MDLVQVLIQPLITEKSTERTAFGEYTFKVSPKATKKEIARAVEKFFKVDVRLVRTMKVHGKKRRVGRYRHETKLPDWKKAIVKLAPEQKIDAFELPTEK
ncbi:MAG TPA: 50S ribosomal protein L23 [Candidatus Bathyarchaeia archaeon]|nr:50S ribosomal protein L23 [Candidatus Bathyarchaeia archaeon]